MQEEAIDQENRKTLQNATPEEARALDLADSRKKGLEHGTYCGCRFTVAERLYMVACPKYGPYVVAPTAIYGSESAPCGEQTGNMILM